MVLLDIMTYARCHHELLCPFTLRSSSSLMGAASVLWLSTSRQNLQKRFPKI